MAETLEQLETQRAVRLRALAETGDMRQGSITETYRACGKGNCACAAAAPRARAVLCVHAQGVSGKTQTVQLRPGPALTKLLREVDTYHQFRRGIEDLVAVNEAMCRLRPLDAAAASPQRRALKKIAAIVQAEVAQEIQRLVDTVVQAQQRRGHLDLAATELEVRGAMQHVGQVLLEEVLNLDLGQRGTRIACGGGHQAAFVSYRDKQLQTVVGTVRVRRAYYHCGACQTGVIPKDHDLDVVDTAFSPGARRLMARVGAQEAFAAGRQDLAELAGLVVHTKEVERVSERCGAQMEAAATPERAVLSAGTVVPLTRWTPLSMPCDSSRSPRKAPGSKCVKTSTTSRPTRCAWATDIFAVRASLSVRGPSRPAAKPSSVTGSSSRACGGPSPAPTR